jgi:hypothetical protein
MGDGNSVARHMNTFNTIVTQMISVGVKMDEEDFSMTLLCSFPDSWDNLVMSIGITMKDWCLMRLLFLYSQSR